MKEWLTAKEIADQRLPDVPATERAIQILAEREHWNSNPAHARKRAGRGGGMEYHIKLLPTLAKVAYRQRHMRVGLPDMPPAANDEPRFDHFKLKGAMESAKAALERDARLAVVRAFERFLSGQSLNRTGTTFLFVTKYNARSLQIEPWVLDHVPMLSKRSLDRWCAATKAGATQALAVDKAAARKGKGVIDTAEGGRLRTFVLALLADNQHLSAEHVRNLCRSEFGDCIKVMAAKGVEKTIDMPPVRTFQHALKALRTTEKVVLTKIQNPDLFRSTMAPAGRGSLRHVDEPNLLWMIDASPVDALCTDGRHAIYACIDMATRRLKLSVSRTPRASAVALLLRKAILGWGAPETIKTDNGSDFVARDTKRLFASLGIEMEISDAYQPQQKGHVERVIRTFQHDCATLLPGFIGHNVADRKAIESRRSFAERLGTSDAQAFGVELTGAALQDIVDRWVESVYQRRGHDGLGGRTPELAAAASRRAIRTVDERALDLLLMPVAGSTGTRTVTKLGIRVDGQHYMTPSILPGTQVLARMDPADAGLVYAFEADGGRFLGVGICPELSGIHPETIVKAVKAAQREIVERGTAGIKAEIRRLKSGPSYIERILSVAAADAPNVVALPKPEVEHSTPQIAAALEAVRPAEPAKPLEGRAAEIHAQLVAEMSAEAAPVPIDTVSRLPETPHQRFRRALDLLGKIERGEPMGEDNALWLGRYMEGPEYRGLKAVHDDFGDAMRL